MRCAKDLGADGLLIVLLLGRVETDMDFECDDKPLERSIDG